MRIAIDCRWIYKKLSGIGRHTDNLVKGVTALDKNNHYILLREPLVPYGIFTLSNQLKLQGVLKKLDVDVYHSTNFMIPLFLDKKIKVVITIHDLIPWLYPEFTPKAKKTKFNWLFKAVMKKAVKRADRIIAVSENTAQDIQKCFNISGDKIRVVYNGIEQEYFNAAKNTKKTSNPISDKLEKGYILFVGRSEPYKNLLGLVKAYDILVKKYNIPNKLLIVGERDPRYPQVPELVDKLGLKDKVIFFGYAEQKEVMGLYLNAGVLAMPSFYEGFGLPVTEAMACGVPVVVSNTPALVEVAGCSALVVDPKNINEIAGALYKVLTDKELADELKRKGIERAKHFTIERMAEETIKVYESCINS